MEDLKLIIANNLSDLRKKEGMTQLELADRLNYSDKAVSKWERGESLPDVMTLKALADIFSVSVDYLLLQEHTQEVTIKKEYSKRQKRNHTLISCISAVFVWLIATFIYVNIDLIFTDFHNHWLIFIYAVPVTCIVLLVFNSIWGNRRLNFLIVSVLMWSVLASICLSALQHNLWLVLVLGIPGQVIIGLWAGLKFK